MMTGLVYTCSIRESLSVDDDFSAVPSRFLQKPTTYIGNNLLKMLNV